MGMTAKLKDETLTYHNDKELKQGFVRETIHHAKHDQYERGGYHISGEPLTDSFRGCSAACAINSLKKMGRNGIAFNDHAGLAKHLGWPEWLVHLQDFIYEGLPEEESVMWTTRLARAVPVGAATTNLNRIKWSLNVFLMEENIKRVEGLDTDSALKRKVLASINMALKLNANAVRTGKWDATDAGWAISAARWTAISAARWVTYSAAISAALSVADWAAVSARSAALSVALSVADSARSAARSAALSGDSAAYTRYSRQLLKLLADKTLTEVKQ